MKVALLAGGFGTRLSEYTETIPKPMVPVGGKPILWHIMSGYSAQGFNDFVVALGYKGELIKDYFVNYRLQNSNLEVNLATGDVSPVDNEIENWRVSLIDTGRDSLTGGRLGPLRNHLKDDTFMLTYGDAVADVDLNALVDFHRSHGRLVTVTAVHPPARFGELQLVGEKVVDFQEKPQVGQGWVNGGFFVMEPEFLSFIKDDQAILEHEPLEKTAELGELMAFCHQGFWHCMDVKRDKDALDKLWNSGERPWVR